MPSPSARGTRRSSAAPRSVSILVQTLFLEPLSSLSCPPLTLLHLATHNLYHTYTPHAHVRTYKCMFCDVVCLCLSEPTGGPGARHQGEKAPAEAAQEGGHRPLGHVGYRSEGVSFCLSCLQDSRGFILLRRSSVSLGLAISRVCVRVFVYYMCVCRWREGERAAGCSAAPAMFMSLSLFARSRSYSSIICMCG